MPSTSFDLDLEVVPVGPAVLDAATRENGTAMQGRSTVTTTRTITSATVTATCCC